MSNVRNFTEFILLLSLLLSMTPNPQVHVEASLSCRNDNKHVGERRPSWTYFEDARTISLQGSAPQLVPLLKPCGAKNAKKGQTNRRNCVQAEAISERMQVYAWAPRWQHSLGSPICRSSLIRRLSRLVHTAMSQSRCLRTHNDMWTSQSSAASKCLRKDLDFFCSFIVGGTIARDATAADI